MFSILSMLLSSIISDALNYILDFMNGQLIEIGFNAQASIGSYFTSATGVIYNLGISLIVLKFLKKGFDIYVLWDGDPDMEPAQLFLNFVKALAVAVAFRPIYDIFVKTIKDATSNIVVNISGWNDVDGLLAVVTKFDFVHSLVLLIAIIMYFILIFKIMMTGINLMILNIGMPIACTGLLDNDKGVFKNYFMQYVKAFLTVLIQITLTKIGIVLAMSFSLTSGNIVNIFWGIAVLAVAMGTPKLLAEFLIPSQGGGLMNKMYPVMNLGNMATRIIKK